MGWLWLFTTDLSNTAVPQSQILSMSLFFPFSLVSVQMGWVVALNFPVILILTSDFTRTPARVRMAATSGMLLEHCSAMHTHSTCGSCPA